MGSQKVPKSNFHFFLIIWFLVKNVDLRLKNVIWLYVQYKKFLSPKLLQELFNVLDTKPDFHSA